MAANKGHKSESYDRTSTWDDGRTINYNEKFEVQGFTKVSDKWPSKSSIERNLEQRKALGGGKNSPYRYHTTQRQDWYVDFDAKAFWASDNC